MTESHDTDVPPIPPYDDRAASTLQIAQQLSAMEKRLDASLQATEKRLEIAIGSLTAQGVERSHRLEVHSEKLSTLLVAVEQGNDLIRLMQARVQDLENWRQYSAEHKLASLEHWKLEAERALTKHLEESIERAATTAEKSSTLSFQTATLWRALIWIITVVGGALLVAAVSGLLK